MSRGEEGGCVTVIMAALLTALITGVLFGMGAYGCSSRAQMMGLAHSYGLVQGCMVKTKAGWRPVEAIREVDP
jgi:glucose uptake protein GlcU